MGEFSLRTCYPVSQFLVEDKQFNTSVLSYYYDTVLGLVNPNDFTVPSECRRAHLNTQPMPLNARLARSLYSGSLHL